MTTVPAAKWSKDEVAALLQAWRHTFDRTSSRGKLSARQYMYESFIALCGGHTKRARMSVCFKRDTFKNMAEWISYHHAHNPHKGATNGKKKAMSSRAVADRKPKWFSLSTSEKKEWFKRHNLRSYSYTELDYDTYRAVNALLVQANEARNRCYRRVLLRRSHRGKWQAVPEVSISSWAKSVKRAVHLVAKISEKRKRLQASQSSADFVVRRSSFPRTVDQDRNPSLPESLARNAAVRESSRNPPSVKTSPCIAPAGALTPDRDLLASGVAAALSNGSSTESDSELGRWGDGNSAECHGAEIA